jgi:hypothetical protein
VYAPVSVPVCPSGFVTTISTDPGACAGVSTVIAVAVTDCTVAAAPPKVTRAPDWK